MKYECTCTSKRTLFPMEFKYNANIQATRILNLIKLMIRWGFKLLLIDDDYYSDLKNSFFQI